MEFDDVIKKRASCKSYDGKAIPRDVIEKIIDAARQAPSGHNRQAWKFVVVEDVKKLKGIFEQDFPYDAGAIIICCSNAAEYTGDEFTDADTKAVRDLSIASAFITLKATELGIGNCYVAWADREKLKQVLGIPKEYIVPYVITLGYEKEHRERDPKKKLKEIMSYNNFGK